MSAVSIVVPAFNSQGTLEECLRSIRTSIYKDYELIVVDDLSNDSTPRIARKYADRVIRQIKNQGRVQARNTGISASRSEIIVCIDSDVVIKPDTIKSITNYFIANKEISAVTGLFSKIHPNHDFFSQYKNLYMHYTFNELPEKVTFLFGSVCAFRRSDVGLWNSDFAAGEDTMCGQELIGSGKKIAFLKDLEVIHLKRYNFFSLIKNDFVIPFYWAKIFVKFKGWRQLFRNKTGFAHASRKQLLAIIFIAAAALLWIILLFGHGELDNLFFSLSFGWLLVNFQFIRFLSKEKNFFFGMRSLLFTFFDQLVMVSGILCGLIHSAFVQARN
ncbi:MAG: glycosyltransferase family 2 protein [Candidatus Omnitrophica bacterium]|nr:glycosyltransferase family 2 protein [Candidatus Omnitrophota bacterium]